MNKHKASTVVYRPRIMVVGSGGAWWRPSTWFSHAIEGIAGGPWSHMANVLGDGSIWDAQNVPLVMDGKLYPAGVQHRPAGYLDPCERWAVFEAPAGSEAHYAAWVKDLESQEGKPYDFPGIWDFPRAMLLGRYTDPDYAPEAPQDSKAWFCDEYCDWAAIRRGLIPRPPTPPYTFSPGASLNLYVGARWRLVKLKGFTACA